MDLPEAIDQERPLRERTADGPPTRHAVGTRRGRKRPATEGKSSPQMNNEIANLGGAQGQLKLFDRLMVRITEATRVEELRKISDGMTGLRFLARKAKDHELEALAIQLRMRAQRRAGEMLITLKVEGRREKAHQGGNRKSWLPRGNHDFPQVLSDLGITKKDSMLWQRIARIPEDLFEARIARLLNSDPLLSHESDEWLTPEPVIAAAAILMGAIDLDPCAESREPHNVPATLHLSKANDGLSKLWRGRIFMNPPYSAVDNFAEKLIRDWRGGLVEQAIALVAVRTDAAWFRMFKIAPVCFISGRLRFRRACKAGVGSEEITSAPFPSAAIYLGPESRKRQFCAAFAPLGQIRDMVIAG